MNRIHHLIDRAMRGEHITLNFVGDSITHGINHCRPEETYVAKVAAEIARRLPTCTVRRYDGMVEDEGKPMAGFDGPVLVSLGTGRGKIDVIRNGIGGNTVRRLIRRLDDFTGPLPNGRAADITLIMVGINDSLDCDPAKYVTPEVFAKDYQELIDAIRARDPETMVVLISATFNGPGDGIAPYCAHTEALAAANQLPYIDLHAFWWAHFDPEAPHFGQGEWLSAVPWDACHPSPLGAEMTARRVVSALLD